MEKLLLGRCASTRIVVTHLVSLKHILTDVKKKWFTVITRGHSSPKYIKKKAQTVHSYK